MKNLINEIKETSTNKFVDTFFIDKDTVDANGKLKLMSLFTTIENALKIPVEVLNSVSTEYHKELISMDFKKHNEAFEGDTLELEFRFYGIDKKTVALKAFVRKTDSNKKQKKIAQVKYIYKAVFAGQQAA